MKFLKTLSGPQRMTLDFACAFLLWWIVGTWAFLIWLAVYITLLARHVIKQR